MKPNAYVLSGVGLSADSGLATFRSGGNATWNQVDLNVVCNYHNWRVNPEPDNVGSFGVIEAATAGVGLKNLERILVELM